MTYLLDTNHCVYLKNAMYKRPERQTEFEVNTLKAFTQIKFPKNDIFVSVVSIGELYFGVEKSDRKEKNYKKVEFLKKQVRVEELDDNVWRLFAKTRVELMKQGKGITDFDLLIACTAKAYGHILVSNDSDHKGLPKDFPITNWANKSNLKV